NVILPLRNLPELDEIPSEVRRRIQVIPVDRVEEIFALAAPPKRKKA
ncbi:MAG: hypothetical protein EHM19_10605, partial [Candidatus Latescibacterota bacterium]